MDIQLKLDPSRQDVTIQVTAPQRTPQVEELLDPTLFVRISNGEIVNLDQVRAVDLSLTGTIRMTLTGGECAYVSRRYVKKIKETLGLRKERPG